MLHFFWVLFFFCFSFFSVICSTARTFDVCILCANNYIIIILIVRLPSVPEWTFLESYEQLTDLFIYLFIIVIAIYCCNVCAFAPAVVPMCWLFICCMYVCIILNVNSNCHLLFSMYLQFNNKAYMTNKMTPHGSLHSLYNKLY